jgi:hypothetical protein
MTAQMNKRTVFHLTAALALSIVYSTAKAQTVDDAIMMNKKQWCNGLTYMHSSWNQYWEGAKLRSNPNMGTVTTQSVMLMTNYGITDKLNVLVNVPYVWTQASQGTLHGLQGFQDIDVDVKYEFYSTKIGKGKLSMIGLVGLTTPLSKYENDFLPMSIGLGSTNLSGRLTLDYQKGIFFTTLSSAYVFRSNITIDASSYYADGIHYTNQVYMPNQLYSNFFVGIRKTNLTVQAQVYNMYTFGGTDIRTNDFPFPGNQMNMTSVGAHVKYFLPFIPNLEVIGGADFTVAGKNMGKSQMYTGGLFYIVSL